MLSRLRQYPQSVQVTLIAEIKHQPESAPALKAVSQGAGVGGITNNLTVITAGGR